MNLVEYDKPLIIIFKKPGKYRSVPKEKELFQYLCLQRVIRKILVTNDQLSGPEIVMEELL